MGKTQRVKTEFFLVVAIILLLWGFALIIEGGI